MIATDHDLPVKRQAELLALAGTRAQHPVYPYLLRNLVIDWATRKVLSWRVSNTLTSDFCIDAPQEALNRYGTPEIFNTDQGSQFTSLAFTSVLKEHGIRIQKHSCVCTNHNRICRRGC